ncbi:UDP-glycosyltransferase 73C2-like [Musa acuminata AAA Group]|uniref:UDP-glycosyltransferase 73C2-like n=1 Tax=Musa acuminata AAA Group TaxID=214697 RepID=UPI0031D7EE12
MSYVNRKPHFVLVPLLVQGHMIPVIDLARLLALQAVAVRVVTTPGNTSRFKVMIDRANAAGLLIQFGELRFPCAEVGLSEGCQNYDVIPSWELVKNFYEALSMLREPLLFHLRQQCPKPSCVISDASDTFEPFLVPDLPHKVEVVRAQSMSFFDYPGWEKLRDEVAEAESTADELVMNRFRELEAAFIDSYQKALEKKVWATGPVCLSNKETSDKVAGGSKTNVDENYIRKLARRQGDGVRYLLRMLREELQLLQEPGSYVGEVVKVMGKSKVLVKAVCTEAGMFALRERRVHVTQEDFEMAVAKVMKKETEKNMSLGKLWK